jgi:hypothetical protein
MDMSEVVDAVRHFNTYNFYMMQYLKRKYQAI